MKRSQEYAALTLLLTACSAGGRRRSTPDALDPTPNQEIDPNKAKNLAIRQDGKVF